MGRGDVLLVYLWVLAINLLSYSLISAVYVPELIRLPVGKALRLQFETTSKLTVRDASDEPLPSWLLWNDSTRLLEGIPQFSNIGETFIRVTEAGGTDSVLEIRVSEESVNPCGDEQKTVWMELAFDVPLQELSIGEQLETIDKVSEYVGVNSSLLRIYTNQYKDEIRRSEVFESGLVDEPTSDDTFLLWKVSCNDLDDDGLEALENVLTLISDEAIELEHKPVGWKLTKGLILSRKQRHEGAQGGVLSQFSAFATNEPEFESAEVTTTPVPHKTPSTSTITTRLFTRSTKRFPLETTKRTDNPPVRLNSLPTFHCKRGTVCELQIPEKTFMDAEDGDTRSLKLSVYPIVADKNWLTVDRSRQVLRGISLNQGDFEFRLEARDSANQMTSAAFRVSVDEVTPSNHLFIFDIQKSYQHLTKDPDTMLAFATKLAHSLGDRLPKNIVIRNVEAKNAERSLITWSNSSLSHKICQRKAIDALKYQMVTRRRDRIRNEFLRAMDSRFHVRNVQLELRDSCLEMTTVAPERESNIPVGGTASPQPEIASLLPSLLWIPIVLGAVFLLLLIVLILVCCLSKRKHQKAVPSEYVSKGMPVVFPEEIPQEDEAVTVATPMLVREERPPLIIPSTSPHPHFHDNHLYKPPPPLSSTSSPRPRSSATNQRLPPPYVPP